MRKALPRIKPFLAFGLRAAVALMTSLFTPSRLVTPSRRGFLQRSLQIAAAGGLLATGTQQAFAGVKNTRSLAFENLHTNEHLALVFAVGDTVVPQAKSRLDVFLRDHYTGDVGSMDPQLFDLLYRLRMTLGTREPFQVISGYRSPNTNSRLRLKGEGGVAKKSLHMEGKAIDIRLPGVALADLRDAAKSLQAGGVGYYANDEFVHVDTGLVRHW